MDKFRSTSEREFHGRKAREEVAKRHYEHALKQGNSGVSFDKVYKHVDERATIVDKKQRG